MLNFYSFGDASRSYAKFNYSVTKYIYYVNIYFFVQAEHQTEELQLRNIRGEAEYELEESYEMNNENQPDTPDIEGTIHNAEEDYLYVSNRDDNKINVSWNFII